jgi:hypothetical protein
MKTVVFAMLAALSAAATAGAQEAANPVRTVGALDDLIADRGSGRLIGVPRTEQGSGFEPYGLACGALKPGAMILVDPNGASSGDKREIYLAVQRHNRAVLKAGKAPADGRCEVHVEKY